MKKQSFDSSHSKRILTGMIVHDDVLAKIHKRVGDQHSPFNQPWLDLVAGWCFKHFTKYNRAPKNAIRTYFEKHAQGSEDDDTNRLVEKFLEGLSQDYKGLKEEINEDFLVDLASDHFKKVRLRRTVSEIDSALEAGDLESAEMHHSTYRPVDFSSTTFEDPFSKEAILDTFKKVEAAQSIVQWPGDMDRFMTPYFRRGGFIAFAGPEKRGKSFWLLESAWLALKQRRKVLYYALGDMSKHEIYQRLYCRTLRRPWKTEEIQLPKGITLIGENKKEAEVRFRAETRKGLRPKDVWKARKQIMRVTASNQINLKVKVTGGYVVTATDIERDVADFADREGWVPDMVVLDYADLVLPEAETRKMDLRHQINLTWMVFRRIALNRHLLFVTATQTAATSYDKWVIKKADFSEDKRKHAHVSGMLGLNQTTEEKESQIYRLNWIDNRHGKWSENQVIWTAGNLSISCPCIVSKL